MAPSYVHVFLLVPEGRHKVPTLYLSPGDSIFDTSIPILIDILKHLGNRGLNTNHLVPWIKHKNGHFKLFPDFFLSEKDNKNQYFFKTGHNSLETGQND